MKSLEDRLRELSSGDRSDRIAAGLVLHRTGILSHRSAVRQMVLHERDGWVIMCLAPSIVGWKDETLGLLLRTIADNRAVYSLIESARIQRQPIQGEQLRMLLASESLFVQLSALKFAYVSGTDVDFVSRLNQLRSDAEAAVFMEDDPVFANKGMFLRYVSRFCATASRRANAKEL